MIVFTNNNCDYKMERISKNNVTNNYNYKMERIRKNNVTNRHTVKQSSRKKIIKVTKSNKEFLRALGFKI